MAYLMDWVRQIALFLIFVTLFYQMTPNPKYQRYIRFYASLILVILTLNPLFSLFRIQDSLEWNQDLFSYPQEVEEFRLRAEQAQGEQYEQILEGYRQSVAEHLAVMAGQKDLYVVSSEVGLSGDEESFGQISSVSMTVSYRRDSEGETTAEIRIEPVEIGEEEETEARDSSSPGNTDTAALAGQIAQLYQLAPEEVSVILEE